MAIIYFPSGNTSKQTDDWLSVDPNAGDGDAAVSVSADVYTGRSNRTFGTASQPAIVVAAGNIQKKFYVTQSAKTEFATISVNKTAAAAGDTLTISGTSNSSKLTFSWKSGSNFSNAITTFTAAGSTATNGVALEADPGDAAQYTYSFTLAIPNNTSTSAKSGTLVVTCNGGQTAEATISQTKGAKTDYSTWAVYVYSNPTAGISASGGTSKISGYSYRTYKWNGTGNKITEYQTATISTDLGKLSSTTIGGTSGSGSATLTLENNESEGKQTATITAVAYSSGAKAICTVVQESGEVVYGDWQIEELYVSDGTSSGSPIAARGGSATVKVLCYRTYTLNGVGETYYEYAKVMLSSSNKDAVLSQTMVDGDYGSATLTWSNNMSTSSKETTITATCYVDESVKASAVVYQEKGAIVYSKPTISNSTSYYYIGYGSQSNYKPATISYSQSWTWNGVSGSGGTINSGGTLSYSMTAGNGFTKGTNFATTGAVNVATNEGIDRVSNAISVTVTLNGQTSSAYSYRISQTGKREVFNQKDGTAFNASDGGFYVLKQ